MVSTDIDVHYVANIKIEKVEKVKAVSTQPYSRSDPPKNPGREITEVASIVVKGKSLENIVSQVKAHVNLVNEF